MRKILFILLAISAASRWAAGQIIIDTSRTPVTGTVTQETGMLPYYVAVAGAMVVMESVWGGGPVLQAPIPWPGPGSSAETTYTDNLGRYVCTNAVIGQTYQITVTHRDYHTQIRGLTVIDPGIVMGPMAVNQVNFALIQATAPTTYPLTVNAVLGGNRLPDVVVSIYPVWGLQMIPLGKIAAPVYMFGTDTTDRNGEAVFDSVSLVPYVDWSVSGTHVQYGSQYLESLLRGTLGNQATLVFSTSGLCLQKPSLARPALSCYPNPFNPTVNFQIQGTSGRQMVRIYDLSGKMVANVMLLNGSGQWPAKNHPAGIYLVKWAGERAGGTQRILLKK